MRGGVGEVLLTSKLQILNGTGSRRPSIALSILTGRVAEQLSILESLYDPRYPADQAVANETVQAPVPIMAPRPRRQYAAHTVYLSETHLRDIESIIEAWQQVEPRRLTRSAVLRRAVEHLRTAVEADSAKFILEKD
jgi:hypothetical protein